MWFLEPLKLYFLYENNVSNSYNFYVILNLTGKYCVASYTLFKQKLIFLKKRIVYFSILSTEKTFLIHCCIFSETWEPNWRQMSSFYHWAKTNIVWSVVQGVEYFLGLNTVLCIWLENDLSLISRARCVTVKWRKQEHPLVFHTYFWFWDFFFTITFSWIKAFNQNEWQKRHQFEGIMKIFLRC